MSSEVRHRSRTENRPRTCDICKLRHQKCNGAQPACHHCASRGLQCNYSNTQARKLDPSAVRRANLAPRPYDFPSPSQKRRRIDSEALGISANNYSIVHEILKTGLSDSGLTSLRQSELSRVLTDDIIRKTRILQSPQPALCDPSKRLNNNTTTARHLIDILAHIWANELEEKAETLVAGPAPDKVSANQNQTIPTKGVSWSLGNRRESLPPKDRAEKWLEIHLRGPNKLMQICSPEESQQLLNFLYDPNQRLDLKSECLITWQLAVGARFTADTDEQTYTAAYESARMQTEICIEEDDDMLLWVVPTLLLRCVYLINPQPRKCWLLLGLAIRISQIHRIDLSREQCPHLSDTDYLRWREVWRAAIFLDSWLAMILGRVPQITALTTNDPFIQNIQTELRSPNHEVEVNMAKLAVLTSGFLSNYDPVNKIDLTLYERHLHSLEEWSSSLPQNLRYFSKSSPLTKPSNLSIEDEFASLYLKEFYFASVLVATKPLLLDVVTTYRERDDMSIPSNVRFFAQTCTDSAIQIASISTSMMELGFICQRSWLVTTLSYHASLVLALGLSMKGPKTRWNLTSAQEASRRQVGTNGLKFCIDVLSFCTQQDPYAGHFLKTVSVFKDILETQGLLVSPQSQNPSFQWPKLGSSSRSSGSDMLASGLSSEAASFRVPTNSDPTPSTVSSTFDSPTYPTTSSFSAYSLSHAQNTLAQHFRSQPSQTESQTDAYPAPFDWNSMNTYGLQLASDSRGSQYEGSSDSMKQHYQSFLQDYYNLE